MTGVQLRAELDADVPPSALFAWVADLDRYPAWLEMVRSATREERPEGESQPAWDVVLVGRLGPLRRLKRLRMVRAAGDSAGRARFLRDEHDGKTHARWELTVDVRPRPGGSHLDMTLSYTGSMWGPPLQRLLAAEIEAAKPRLLELARGGVSAP
jgi:hypothetical protein